MASSHPRPPGSPREQVGPEPTRSCCPVAPISSSRDPRLREGLTCPQKVREAGARPARVSGSKPCSGPGPLPAPAPACAGWGILRQIPARFPQWGRQLHARLAPTLGKNFLSKRKLGFNRSHGLLRASEPKFSLLVIRHHHSGPRSTTGVFHSTPRKWRPIVCSDALECPQRQEAHYL